ncbi:beta-ketoacyl-[acyl-carrier-protein] synthase family protein [Facilibium subflavum]|uniref:beta-ketoacyl-[acyl-carrier-protein] synthase family protein n=1 Tax=Facilibium subflavum TaxID=2219058 RepID=UPI000E648D5E|nr:beta-ketoacyl-[acyl-carrier-protein] synthase family protein [Facilibium subflavum]
MKKQAEIYLNDCGIICALGDSKASVAKNLLANAQRLVAYDKLFTHRSSYIGQVDGTLPSIPKTLQDFDCRNNRLLMHAYLQIKPAIDNLIHQYGARRIGIILGTSTSGILEGEKAYAQYTQQGYFPKGFHYKQQEFGQISRFLAKLIGVQGPCYTISTACSSSGKAFMAAKRLIQSDFCDAVIVGGADTLSALPLNGFDALDSVSSSICRPFQQTRDGINIGEGAGLFIMSKQPGEISLAGGGESSDGFHITSPDPEGSGAKKAMQRALDDAGIDKSLIGYINAHGTATPKNDAMESKAIFEVFGGKTQVSSTKPLTGHTLGAASVIELALCWLLLSKTYNPDRLLPAQFQNDDYDQNIAPICLTKGNTHWQTPYFMSNSFAFGGNNVSLIIKGLS